MLVERSIKLDSGGKGKIECPNTLALLIELKEKKEQKATAARMQNIGLGREGSVPYKTGRSFKP